jgi:hypothetical protein
LHKKTGFGQSLHNFTVQDVGERYDPSKTARNVCTMP